MSAVKIDKILVAFNQQEWQHPLLWQNSGSSESHGCKLQQFTESIASSRFKVALKATKMSAVKVDRVLAALKTTVDKNVNSHCWQDFGSSKNYVYQLQ